MVDWANAGVKKTSRLFSPLFSRKIVEIEHFSLRAAIMHECENHLGGGGAPPPRAIIPDARPHGTFENQDDRHYWEDVLYLDDLTEK